MRRLIASAAVWLLVGCSAEPVATPSTQELPAGYRTAVFAGGCFWCMEPPFDKQPGVLDTRSGFAGGAQPNPSYRAVTAGGTGHLEVVQVSYDPKVVSYEALLAIFWRNIDSLDDGGQFCDRGDSYRTAIFVADAAQRDAALASLEQLSGRFAPAPVVTRVLDLPASGFSEAEAYHQDYYLENPLRYKYYRRSCGRDRRLAEVWGDP
ncbi:MAG: peptide-methionine (S)-S-oxide reductase MsrA [Pseudomonadota bacterium]